MFGLQINDAGLGANGETLVSAKIHGANLKTEKMKMAAVTLSGRTWMTAFVSPCGLGR
jgi:hypothetical protein